MSVRTGGDLSAHASAGENEMNAAMQAVGVSLGGEVSGEAPGSVQAPIRRGIVVSIQASLEDLVQQRSSGTWMPTVGATNAIFKQRRFTSLDGTAEAQGDLSSVVLHSIELKHAKSTFPISVGAKVFAVDHNTYASTGEAFSHVLTPNTDRTMTRTLQADPVDLAYAFAAKFPGYTAKNLATRGTHSVAAKRFVLLQADHPVVSAIQENSEKLQLGDVTGMPEGLIKVSSSLYDALLPMVQEQVSTQIRVRDFNNASVTIEPAEFNGWAAARESLVRDRKRVLTCEHEASPAAFGASPEDMAKRHADFGALLAAEEAKIDRTKFDVHMELEVAYNFLSDDSTPE